MTPDDIKKIKCKREQRIPKGVTVLAYDIRMACAKAAPGLDKATYDKIIGAMVDDIKARLMRGSVVTLPHGLGTLCVKQGSHGPYVGKDGELRNGYPVDWKRTLELWCEDEDARREKKKIYNMNRRRSLYLVFKAGRKAKHDKMNLRFIKERRFIADVTGYAEEHKETSYAVKLRRHER